MLSSLRGLKLMCLLTQRTPKRWPTTAYVKYVESRVKRIENLLDMMFPGVDFSDEIGSPITLNSWVHSASASASHTPDLIKHPLLPAGPAQRRIINPNSPEPNSDTESEIAEEAPIDNQDGPYARSLRLLVQQERALLPGWSSLIITNFRSSFQRPEFWRPLFFEISLPPPTHYDLPSRDLLDLLLDTYFSTVGVHFPFLHRAFLLQQISAGLHETNSRFAACLLLVSACAARHSNDPRVLAVPGQWHSAGWMYYFQVEPLVTLIDSRDADILDLQITLLASLYLSELVSFSSLSLALIDKGIRMAINVDAHRRKTYRNAPNLIDELRKRLFWCFVLRDRTSSILLGRRCVILDEEFDLDFPMLVDDECWNLTDHDHNFPIRTAQWNNQPSSLAYFVNVLKLTQITAFILRSLYSINKFKLIKDISVITRMDSALNEWLSEIPDYLNWNPHSKSTKWLAQSSALHCLFYDAQILLHRPFVLHPRAGLPSLEICSNAAHSCIQTFNVQQKRSGMAMPRQAPLVVVCCVVLLLDIRRKAKSIKQSAGDAQFLEHWRDIKLAIEMLRQFEHRCKQSGKFVDILLALTEEEEALTNNWQELSSTSKRSTAQLHPTAKKTQLKYGRKMGPACSVVVSDNAPLEDIILGFDILNFPFFGPKTSAGRDVDAHSLPTRVSSQLVETLFDRQRGQQISLADLWRDVHGVTLAEEDIISIDAQSFPSSSSSSCTDYFARTP
ncbi:fungal-specific transcription factor domain-containing protein [Auriculariales sp. MPI-PUGE-AT-0066]|nr:fungal-specific transcription factor domain-containing protein [Auriculariales sp. MPI-PUGE-AT-0066]